MQTVNLYRYNDYDGITITPNQRELTDKLYCYRLIADNECVLINGKIETPCIDTHEPELWYEISNEEINN